MLKKSPPDEVNTDTTKWPLSQHQVLNHHKPSKLRLKCDCPVKSNGVSFNDALIQRPSLVNSLIGGFVRLLKEQVSIPDDKKSMLYQVRVNSLNCHALQFLC